MKMMRMMMAAALCAALGGCGKLDPATVDAIGGAIEEAIASRNEPDVPVETPVVVTPAPDVPVVANPAPTQSDFAGITKFRNSADCRNWPVTVTVSDVGFRGGNITWRESGHTSRWNTKSSGGKTIDGECLLVIPSRGEAGMFDYKRVGQREKILSNLKPGHEGPGFFPGWVPVKGERVGFLIATISRDRGAAKMQERSNVVWFTWPRDGI